MPEFASRRHSMAVVGIADAAIVVEVGSTAIVVYVNDVLAVTAEAASIATPLIRRVP